MSVWAANYTNDRDFCTDWCLVRPKSAVSLGWLSDPFPDGVTQAEPSTAEMTSELLTLEQAHPGQLCVPPHRTRLPCMTFPVCSKVWSTPSQTFNHLLSCWSTLCYQDQDILKLVYLQVECSIPKFTSRPSHLDKHQMAKENGKKIKTRLLGKLPVSETPMKAVGKEVQNWVIIEKLLLFCWHQKAGLRDLIPCKNPREMPLTKLLGGKVMLFTCKTFAFSRKVSTINLDSDNVSQE